MGYHEAVLLKESIAGLRIDPNGTYVDVTFGGGGHSKSILEKLDKGTLFAFDQDTDAQKNSIDDNRFVLINQNFRFMQKFLRLEGVLKVDGILADLGVSSYQFDTAERGFSIREEGELDMRMNITQELSAKQVVNEYELDDLCRIFREYGELKNAFSISKSILLAREEGEILTTEDLKNAVKKHIPQHKSNKILAQLFQAIRIEVNDELKALKEMLLQSVDLLKTGGRLSVISYHSLEDRLVKNLIKSGNFKGDIEKDFYGVPNLILKAISKKPITASQEELESNPRSRSAKLRVSEKLA
ncbi:16S rRNA (cytosine(1402)-N(4))-methyltransferase RsmH [Flavobacteriales bacterium]|jgi:16S rRNA (cytosine1402-N4)-methyltransferase|nr:16S rRNA (cytosine(1402)-N(4))-methyltransferase RsmH [Flavobacteriales bacterium]